MYLYACHCDSTRQPVLSDQHMGRCFRVNGTDDCGSDFCNTDTFFLDWVTHNKTTCLALQNGTDDA